MTLYAIYILAVVAAIFLGESARFSARTYCTDFARDCTPFHASFCVQMPIGDGHRRTPIQKATDFIEGWWAHKGSNLGPLPCEGNALPLSYAPGRHGGGPEGCDLRSGGRGGQAQYW